MVVNQSINQSTKPTRPTTARGPKKPINQSTKNHEADYGTWPQKKPRGRLRPVAPTKKNYNNNPTDPRGRLRPVGYPKDTGQNTAGDPPPKADYGIGALTAKPPSEGESRGH